MEARHKEHLQRIGDLLAERAVLKAQVQANRRNPQASGESENRFQEATVL